MGAFPQAAEIGQPSAANEGERVVAASSPPSTVHGQHATDDSWAAQALDERVSLAPALSADDISDDEMAPPRVTRPLPPDPPAPAPVGGDLVSAPARAPPPPIVPKRISLPPSARAIPAPSTDSSPRVQSSSPHRAPIAKRASLAPPPRKTPSPTPESLDIVSVRAQPSTRRTSLPPPTRTAPSPSVSRKGSLVPPPPPPPPLPPGLSYSERDSRESGQTREEELIAPPPHAPTPTRKPTIPPPVPDGRRNVESRRSTDSRSSHEERHGSAQYATLIAPAISGPITPPSKKHVLSPLPLETEVLDEDIGGALLPYYGSQFSLLTPPQIPLIHDSTLRQSRPAFRKSRAHRHPRVARIPFRPYHIRHHPRHPLPPLRTSRGGRTCSAERLSLSAWPSSEASSSVHRHLLTACNPLAQLSPRKMRAMRRAQ